ncbi:beta-N-acetylhexosaminidase [Rheinheimera riviphila]|uniref:beta-N-acetylhexosaminidase n=1 Tax=Rheinheimera riviphila TaxID=1834037 RepID=UPI0013E2D7F9|nr:family 20 glycosylhydrolase [Rheinheimera riviphila]
MLAAQPLFAADDLPLMPYPLKLERQTGALLLVGDQTELRLDVELVLADATQNTATDGKYLIQHLQQRLTAQAGRPVLLQSVTTAVKPTLRLEIGKLLTIPKPGDDESYQLQITPQHIHLQANTSTGALYGLETLTQLLDCPSLPATSSPTPHCQWPTVTIEDQPRFPWRGLLIDSARRFVPLADLKRQLQGMASAKLNVLHWHLTDDQGWRFESLSYSKLTQFAGGEFYTQAQMRELVSYAAKLGIRVVPEIDLPGHASAIGRAYPQLLAEPGSATKAERRFGVFAPVLDVSSPEVTAFAAALLKEVAAIFPDPYLHIGGDEVKPEQWLQNPAIQQFMQQQQLADAGELHADFNRRLALQLKQLNRTMIGWDEVLHKDLPKNVLVQSWQGQNAVAESVRAGHPTILSAGYYLDQPMPTSYHYRNDPVGVAQPLPPLPADGKQIVLDFQLARFNNKPVSGQFILLPTAVSQNLQQPQLRMRVPARGELAPRWVQQRSKADGSSDWVFAIDSWLGPAEIQLQGRTDGSWHASAMLGNTRYPLTVKLASNSKQQLALPVLPTLTAASQQQLILGGEAALWAELVPATLLDLKLWPRLYAFAERLWSPADMRDESSMYQRLQQMDDYGSRIGLLHQQQQRQGLATLASNEAEAAALLVLSETVEQSQYYSRHHLKTVRGQYHLDAELARFADALPAESLALVVLQKQLATNGCAAIGTSSDRAPQTAAQRASSIHALQQQFQRWQQAAAQLKNYQGKQQARIKHLTAQLAITSDIALQWLAEQQRLTQQPTTGNKVRKTWDLQRQQLQIIINEVDEELLALAQPVQQMLECREAGIYLWKGNS